MVVITLQQWIQTMEIITGHGSPFPHILWGVAPPQFVSYPNEFASDANNPRALGVSWTVQLVIYSSTLQPLNQIGFIFKDFQKCFFSSMLE